MNTENQSQAVSLALAFCGGVGITMMMIAAGIGVVQGTAADSSAIGLAFIAGLALLIVGVVAWFAVVQPQKHFDDINVPQYHGHDEHHDDAAHSEDHAIVEHQA